MYRRDKKYDWYWSIFKSKILPPRRMMQCLKKHFIIITCQRRFIFIFHPFMINLYLLLPLLISYLLSTESQMDPVKESGSLPKFPSSIRFDFMLISVACSNFIKNFRTQNLKFNKLKTVWKKRSKNAFWTTGDGIY